MTSQRVAVIGGGLIGSAAAKYLAQSGCDVTLFGPDEPQDYARHQGVFGSHYDEGRIARTLDPHPVWQELAVASVQRYRLIEQESGISFFWEAGLLIGAPEGNAYLCDLEKVMSASGVNARRLTGAGLRAAFPYLSFAPGSVLYHQSASAGYVSPRGLVAAQRKIARACGARHIDSPVEGLEPGKVVAGGDTHSFDRILVAAGCYSLGLLAGKVALSPMARTIVFFEVSETEAQRLKTMPPIIYRTPEGDAPYVLPPIRYPDGKAYLKIGGEFDTVSKQLSSAQEISAWFKGQGDAELELYFSDLMRALVPALVWRGRFTKTCVVTQTETDLPYIGELEPGIYIAAGGCGGAAKSSDEIGRIAARAVMGQKDNRFEIIKRQELGRTPE